MILQDQDNGVARICACQQQKRLERLFKSSEITPAFRSKSFENYDAKRIPAGQELLECARDYAERFFEIEQQENNWLVLLGEPGCGKTHLSMAVANRLLASEVQALYFQHVEGINELKDMLHNEDRINERINRMKKVRLLIWDDLWKKKKGEEPSKFEFDTVFEVLNYRYLNLLPTIISSEKDPKQLLEIDKAIGSRILERGRPHLCIVEGIENNYRLV